MEVNASSIRMYISTNLVSYNTVINQMIFVQTNSSSCLFVKYEYEYEYEYEYCLFVQKFDYN